MRVRFLFYVVVAGTVLNACAGTAGVPTPGGTPNPSASPTTVNVTFPASSRGITGSFTFTSTVPTTATAVAATSAQVPAAQANLRSTQSVCGGAPLVTAFNVTLSPIGSGAITPVNLVFANIPQTVDYSSLQLELFFTPPGGTAQFASTTLTPPSISGTTATFTLGAAAVAFWNNQLISSSAVVSVELLACPTTAAASLGTATFTFNTTFNSIGSSSPTVLPTPTAGTGYTLASLSLPGTSASASGQLNAFVSTVNFDPTTFGAFPIPTGGTPLDYLTMKFAQAITFKTATGLSNDFCFPASLATASTYTFSYFINGSSLGTVAGTKAVNDSTCATSTHIFASSTLFNGTTVPANTGLGILISSP